MFGEENKIMQEAMYNMNRNILPMIFYDEKWVQISSIIPEVEDRYFISNYGRVYDDNRNLCLSPHFQPNGYLSITLQKKKEYCNSHNDHAYHITIHRLVCMAFYEIPENYKELQVNHKNSIRSDCYYENLEWMTPKENVAHSFNSGNRGIGENSNRNVYSENTIRQICELMQFGVYDYDTISMKVFGRKHTEKDKALIYEIRNRLFWTSVSCDYEFDPTPTKFALTKEQVHAVCKIIEEDSDILMNPKNKSAANIIALRALGIDLHSLEPQESKKIRDCINNIKRKSIYKSISSQYNF